MDDVTRILNDSHPNAAERLLPMIYDELRQLASARMAREQPGQTLQPTGLVHEAWLRLVGDDAPWDSRNHFFAAAAEAMRRILIERARRKATAKYGRDHQRVEFDSELLQTRDPDERLLQLDAALARFAELEPARAQLVKLRYFAGCSIREAADLLNISTATADRYWAYAKAWLQHELEDFGDS